MRKERSEPTASTADFKEIISSLDTFEGMNGVVLYLDEIQYLNKKQQQTLLEFLENGQITLIASTTENPYFYIYNAIISRSTVFEFKAVSPQEIEKALERGVKLLQQQAQEEGLSLQVEDQLLRSIALSCGGDVRKSINTLEIAYLSAPIENNVRTISAQQLQSISQRAALRYDKSDDVHYDLLSALQKSIRGSDENAALHYLARLLEAGDLISPCRRLLVIASEDVGMAYPICAVIVKACVDSALQLGLPEARIPLAQAVVTMATAPKSNSSYMAINRAMADIRAGKVGDFPRCLQNKHFDGAEVIITYHTDISVLLCQQIDQLKLYKVRVLVLVHHDIPEFILIIFQHIRVCLKKFYRFHQQIVEIQGIILLEFFLVFPVNLSNLFLPEVRSRLLLELIRRDPVIFRRRNP